MYTEEVDLCWRATRAGWEIWYRPEGEAVHHGGKSTEAIAGPMFAELHRSKVRFFRRHRSPAAVLLARLFLATGAFLRALLWSAVFLAATVASPARRRRAGRRAAPFWHAVAAHLRS
jgi:GT2 family glycosyltransferase